jgi:hypothetical protein
MRTTKKHFAIFKAECERLRALWGLTGWRFEYHHEPDARGTCARCTVDGCQRGVRIQLASRWTERVTKRQIRYLARHEMVHALLGPIDFLGANRFVTADEYEKGNHEVLERLMRLLPG